MDKIINKQFDAVGMMRKIRDQLSNEYRQNPEKEEKDLMAIRKKYGIGNKQRKASEFGT